MNKPLFKVDSIVIVSATIAEIRSLKLGFITNYFPEPHRLSLWIAKGDCYAERVENTFFIIKRSDFFWSVYYCSPTIAHLADNLRQFQKSHEGQTMVFDIVGRRDQCIPIVKVFQENNFKLGTALVRMTRIMDSIPEGSNNAKVSYAKNTDIPEIYDYLHRFFNERFEQIPYFEELIDYSLQKQILVYKDNETMTGFLIFDHNPSTLYLRYWFTHPDFRDRGVGSKLLHRFFEEGKETKRQLLWVIQTNENAIKRYKHFGFTEENMFDFIMQIN